MITEVFEGYNITAEPISQPSGKWTVSVIIEKEVNGKSESRRFYADDRIHYILKIEAAKEAINLGKI